MRTECHLRQLTARRAFRIARPRREPIENVYLRVEAEGISGWGEASPNAFYNETAAGVRERLVVAAEFLESLTVETVADIERAWSEVWEIVTPSRAAQCAIDLALWDWLARRRGLTVSELAWQRPAQAVRTFSTIGLSTVEELPEKIAELAGFPLIKIKSDENADLTPVQAVRELSDAVIAVDANCAWGAVDLAHLVKRLTALNVAFVEQPLPRGHDFKPTWRAGLPVIADESCVVEEDVDRVAGRFDGFNIKLVKCGGLTPALRMVRRGRELGMTTMVGCMLESSVLIAAGAVVAQETDFADLDGAWLLSDDPFAGWIFARGLLTPPDRPGLGIEPLEAESWTRSGVLAENGVAADFSRGEEATREQSTGARNGEGEDIEERKG